MRFRWPAAAVLMVGLLMLCPGPSAGQPPAGGAFPAPPGGMTFQVQPGGGGGFGQPPGGGGGSGRGGFGGGMRTPPDPEAMWNRISGGQESINLNDPRNQWLKGMIERGGNPLPPNGVLTKQQFAEGMQKMAAARQAAQGGGGQPGGFGQSPGGFGQSPGGFGQPGGSMATPYNPTGGPGGDRERRRDGGFGGPQGFAQNGGGFPGQGPGGWQGQGWPGQGPGGDGSPGQGQGGPPQPKPDDFSQVAIRYGKLPPGLPDWFTDLDTDRDAQIGLYEWRAAKRATAEFVTMDLDGDGLLSPQEYLRYVAVDAGQKRDKAIEENGVPDPAPRPSRAAAGTGGPGAGGRMPFGPGGKGGGKGGENGDGGERRQKGRGKG